MPPRVLFALDAGARAPGDAPPGDLQRMAPAVGMCVALDARRSHHLVRVLRLAPGELVEAFDGRGRSFRATIETADARGCVIRLIEPLARQVESALRITLAQCLSSADRMDWTIEKAVELGVARIVPLTSSRSQVRLDAARTARKLEHWRAIVEAACTQSGRSLLPPIAAVQPLGSFVAADRHDGDFRQRPCGDAENAPALRLLLLDPRAARPLSQAQVERGSRVVLLAGPESGLAEEEVREARAAGFEPVVTGPRILRTETAGVAAIAALQALAGDF